MNTLPQRTFVLRRARDLTICSKTHARIARAPRSDCRNEITLGWTDALARARTPPPRLCPRRKPCIALARYGERAFLGRSSELRALSERAGGCCRRTIRVCGFRSHRPLGKRSDADGGQS